MMITPSSLLKIYPSRAFLSTHCNDESEVCQTHRHTKLNLIIFVTIVMITLNLFVSQTPMLKSTRQLILKHSDSNRCVRNVLIDKFPQDQLVPGHDETSRQIIAGTLMSEYEGKIITRFMTSVAAAFRSKNTYQHLI